jgi:pentatricopeptide repeat protein
MNVYAKQGDVDGCYEIFDMMNKDYKKNNNTSNNGQLSNTVKPNIHTYNTLINAWSKSNQSQAPYEAEAILMEMIDMNSRKELNCGPDVVTYNTVLNCWKNYHPDHQSTQMTIGNPSLLSSPSSSSPSSSTVNTMNEKGPQHRAHDILKTLILKYKEEQQQQPEVDEKDSHDVDDSDSSTRNRRRRRRKNPRTRIKAPRPNTFTYSIVMDAYASIGDVAGCYEVFNTMKHDYYKDGNKNAKPNLITYNTLIKAYSKARPGDLLEQRRREQQRREKKVENRVHDDGDGDEDNAAVILSIPVEIENILQEIKDRHRAGFLKEGPNKSTYRSMLVCLNKYPGTEDRVKQILRLLPDNRKR